MDYTVRGISKSDYEPWLLYKHYAKRIPSVSFAFGLFDSELNLCGVCTFGSPPMRQQRIGLIDEKYEHLVLELNRHIINDNIQNGASFFISRCLKMLPNPSVIISYADKDFGHNGFIYQACNFTYHGETQKHVNDMTAKNGTHLVTLMDKTRGMKDRSKKVRELYGDQIEYKARTQKHKYVYIVADKKIKKELKLSIKYKEFKYPKMDNKKYDTSYTPPTQMLMF